MKVLAVFLAVVACAAAAPAATDNEVFYAQCQMMPNSNVADREGNKVYGTVDLRQVGSTGNTEIRLSLTGFNTEDDITLHGFHIHEFGDLSDGCTAMGSHYNPLEVDHGSPLKGPFHRHVGDLGNIEETAGSDVIIKEFSDYLVELNGDYTVVGRGIVVHAHDDDLGRTGVDDSLTTGNAGNRLACCVIGRSDGAAWQ